MHFSSALVAFSLAAGALAGPLQARQAWGSPNGPPSRPPVGVPSQTFNSTTPTGTPSGFGHGLEPICRGLNTQDHGCIRYTRGFDVTGVVTEVDLTFPLIQSVCDCIQQCLDRPTTCATYVYKFSTVASVLSGHRTCTLYSQFNLPADVILDFNLNSTLNMNINAAEIIAIGNNPQLGAPVAQAFSDINLNTTADNQAFSGPVWQLATGATQC